jgi:hypothetical protein
VRLFGAAVDAVEPIPYFDVSFNLYRNGLGMVKALTYDLRMEELAAGKRPVGVPISGAWIKSPGAPATQPLKEVGPGDDPGSIIYATSQESMFSLFAGIVEDSGLMVGIKRSGQSNERIYSGKVAIQPADLKQIRDCLNELSGTGR